MNFRLIRMVFVTLYAHVEELTDFPITESKVTVKVLGSPVITSDKQKTLIVLEASQIIETFPTEGNVIHIPDLIRRDLESNLESHVDLIAILNQCNRKIESPSKYIAIEPLNEDAEIWLHGKKIHVLMHAMPIRMWHKFNIPKAISLLQDRVDGVTLLAEALRHQHPTGKLHEYIRFFERAFAKSAGQICRVELPLFLSANEQGYSESEVAHWLFLRDTTAHADKRPFFGLEVDTRPVVNRLEQAAYDVLFNKSTWRDHSTSRLTNFRPTCGSFNTNGDMFLTQGQDATIAFPLVDGYHAYEYNLRITLNSIPSKWLTETTADNRRELESSDK